MDIDLDRNPTKNYLVESNIWTLIVCTSSLWRKDKETLLATTVHKLRYLAGHLDIA